MNCFSDFIIIFIVWNLCDDKEYCEIFVWYNILQFLGVKYCFGVNKYLVVKYICMFEK